MLLTSQQLFTNVFSHFLSCFIFNKAEHYINPSQLCFRPHMCRILIYSFNLHKPTSNPHGDLARNKQLYTSRHFCFIGSCWSEIRLVVFYHLAERSYAEVRQKGPTWWLIKPQCEMQMVAWWLSRLTCETARQIWKLSPQRWSSLEWAVWLNNRRCSWRKLENHSARIGLSK